MENNNLDFEPSEEIVRSNPFSELMQIDEDTYSDEADFLYVDEAEKKALEEKVLSQDEVWSGSIFSVDKMKVMLPEGQIASRDVIKHPGAVAILALTDDDKICLVKQYRAAIDRITIEVPAGKLDPGEDPLDCAHRELKEETGITASKMAYLTTIATTPGFTDEMIHIYMATGLSFGAPELDEDEYVAVELVDSQDLIDCVLDGQIEDAKTVVASLIWDAVSRRLS